jgi:tetratricopeptide (TPR) repeat protein
MKHLILVLACPIAIACTQLKFVPSPMLTSQAQPVADNTVAIASTKYTGVVKRVDEIAQQITVRIEDKNGRNGSGVIVAREGDTYYVATAAHVVESREGEKIAIAVITPTQERIALTQGEINVVNKDVDVAVVKFKSQQNYRTATIGKSQFNKADWVFVSGFPGKDLSKQRHLSIGGVVDIVNTEFRVKERGEAGSLSRGNNLIYTNLSLPGMSGGAVLDRQGRLVGINTGAENESLLSSGKEINFGYALGIRISTVIGAASQEQIPAAQLQIANTLIPESSWSESKEIRRIQLSALSKPSQASTAREWLDYANLLWRSNENSEAIVAFKTAIKLLERNSDISERKEQLTIAYFGLGVAWWDNSGGSSDRQSFQAAVTAFQQAGKVDPKFYQSWRYLGLSLQQLQRYPEALIAYQRAIEVKKDDFVLYVGQGDILREMKRYPEAVSAYTQAVTLQPNHPWVYLNRGTAYANQKQYLQAISDFNYVIKLDPQDAVAYSNRGTVYADQKQYPQAILEYNQAIQLNPKLALAYFNRGVIYANQKQYPQAIADYTQAIQLDIEDAAAFSNRGIAYLEQKQYLEALDDFNYVIELDPQSATAYSNRGLAYAGQKHYSQAILDYNQAIKLDPKLADAYFNRGLVYANQKQYPQAIAEYTQAIKLDPQDAQAYTNRGTVYVTQQQYVKAKIDLKKAAELYRARNDLTTYQQIMALLQELQ